MVWAPSVAVHRPGPEAQPTRLSFHCFEQLVINRELDLENFEVLEIFGSLECSLAVGRSPCVKSAVPFEMEMELLPSSPMEPQELVWTDVPAHVNMALSQRE